VVVLLVCACRRGCWEHGAWLQLWTERITTCPAAAVQRRGCMHLCEGVRVEGEGREASLGVSRAVSSGRGSRCVTGVVVSLVCRAVSSVAEAGCMHLRCEGGWDTANMCVTSVVVSLVCVGVSAPQQGQISFACWASPAQPMRGGEGSLQRRVSRVDSGPRYPSSPPSLVMTSLGCVLHLSGLPFLGGGV
jgi:hypothetical protein